VKKYFIELDDERKNERTVTLAARWEKWERGRRHIVCTRELGAPSGRRGVRGRGWGVVFWNGDMEMVFGDVC